MPYDQRQGMQQALAQIGQQRQAANPYSPFQGQVPAQTLQNMGQQQGPAIPQAMPQPAAPQIPPQGLEGLAQRPQMMPRPQVPQGDRRAALRERLRDPRFLQMLRQRMAQRGIR